MRKSYFVRRTIRKSRQSKCHPCKKKKKKACKKLEQKHAQMRKKSVQFTTLVGVASTLKPQLVPTLENCATYPFDLNCLLCITHNQASVLAHTPTTWKAIKWCKKKKKKKERNLFLPWMKAGITPEGRGVKMLDVERGTNHRNLLHN